MKEKGELSFFMNRCCFCGDDMHFLVRGLTYSYWQCPKCEWYSTTRNEADDSVVDYVAYYDKYQTFDAGLESEYSRFVDESERILNFKFNHLRIAPKSFLDVGCSRGAYVEAYNRLPYSGNSVGVEVSESKVLDGQRRGLNMVDIHHLPEGEFEFVFMRHVIEHVENPWDFLGMYIDYVAHGGVLCIETPNCGSLKNIIWNRNRITEDRYMKDLYPPSHVCGYTSHTFKRIYELIKDKGFEKMEIVTYDGRNNNWGYDYGGKMTILRRITEMFGVAANLSGFYFRR